MYEESALKWIAGFPIKTFGNDKKEKKDSDWIPD
jgi:hypothetical protein